MKKILFLLLAMNIMCSTQITFAQQKKPAYKTEAKQGKQDATKHENRKSSGLLGYTIFMKDIDSLFREQDIVDSMTQEHSKAISIVNADIDRFNASIVEFNLPKEKGGQDFDKVNNSIAKSDSATDILNKATQLLDKYIQHSNTVYLRINPRIKKTVDKNLSNSDYVTEWNGYIGISSNFAAWFNARAKSFNESADAANKITAAFNKSVNDFNKANKSGNKKSSAKK